MKTSKSLTPNQGVMDMQKKPFVMSDQMLLEEALTLLDDNQSQLEELDEALERSIQQLGQCKQHASDRAKLENWFEEVMQ